MRIFALLLTTTFLHATTSTEVSLAQYIEQKEEHQMVADLPSDEQRSLLFCLGLVATLFANQSVDAPQGVFVVEAALALVGYQHSDAFIEQRKKAVTELIAVATSPDPGLALAGSSVIDVLPKALQKRVLSYQEKAVCDPTCASPEAYYAFLEKIVTNLVRKARRAELARSPLIGCFVGAVLALFLPKQSRAA
jgi:hypothetical protein